MVVLLPFARASIAWDSDDHLAARLWTGTFCAYQADPERPVVWDLEPSGRR